MRTIATLMIAPMLYLGTGVTERLWAAAQRPAARESIPAPQLPPVVGYSIDFDGIRWLKTVGVSVTTYLVDRVQPFQQVLEDRVGGAVTATYVHLDDLVAAAFPGTGTRFYHYDGRMSTRKLTDPLAAVTDEYTFDAWGVTLASSGATPNNYLYTGEQFDPNVGLQYNRARYQSLSLGRFISPDPVLGLNQDPISLHKYVYANLNPLLFTDPTGLFTLLELVIASAISNIVMGLISEVLAALGDTFIDLILPNRPFSGEPDAGRIAITFPLTSLANFAKAIPGVGTILSAVAKVGIVILEMLMFKDKTVFYIAPGISGGTSPNSFSVEVGAVWNVPDPDSYEGPFLGITKSGLPKALSSLISRAKGALSRAVSSLAKRQLPAGVSPSPSVVEFLSLLSATISGFSIPGAPDSIQGTVFAGLPGREGISHGFGVGLARGSGTSVSLTYYFLLPFELAP